MAASGNNGQLVLVAILGAIFLAATYIAIGYAVCAGVPFVTEKVAAATVDDTTSPFSKVELVEGAVASQDYSFGSHDLEAYMDTIKAMNQKAGTPYADDVDIADAPEQYTVTREAISHLDDVYAVSARMMMPIFGIAAIAAFLLFAGFRMFGTKPVANMLLIGGCISGGILVLLGLWAIISFDSFFAALHGLFFAQGSWVFPADSLLITMLPGSFWAGIGGVWLTISVLVSALSVLLGIILKRRTCK